MIQIDRISNGGLIESRSVDSYLLRHLYRLLISLSQTLTFVPSRVIWISLAFKKQKLFHGEQSKEAKVTYHASSVPQHFSAATLLTSLSQMLTLINAHGRSQDRNLTVSVPDPFLSEHLNLQSISALRRNGLATWDWAHVWFNER